MKRTNPSKREIARQLIANHHKEQEVLQINKDIREAQKAYDDRPPIGPKPPVYLPYVENEMFY